MQSSDFRSRGPNPLASRRPRSAASLREISSPIPTSRLILAALAVTAARKWIDSSRSVDTGGGEGWCVLGYWFWRIWSDTRSRWKRKGRRKEGLSLRRSITIEGLSLGMVLALQSVAFFAALGQYGPLHTAILLSSCILWRSIDLSQHSSIINIIPSILSTVFILYTHPTAPLHSISAAVLVASSCALDYLSRRLRNSAQTKDKISAPSSATVNVFASIYSLLFVGCLWYLGTIAIPLPNLAKPNAHLLFAGVIFVTSRFVQLPTLTSGNRISPAVQTSTDHITLILSTAAIQFFALPPAPTRSDALIAIPLLLSSVFLIGSRPKTNVDGPSWRMPSTSTGYWSAISLLPPTWRPHLQTILRTPTSSKIFYFLLLNLAYMGVQMAYGVLTNSLGLISDSIHMLFDCLGLAVGLWASVAATWKPDGRYTYGYSRVETLSGFANGCFLILISTFIIFEAIQRVLDPPEMETRQLLLVSSIGLAINLWGMYATGGHHHHGHGHGHDHGHGHSHGHSHHVHEKKEDHRQTNGHSYHTDHKHEHSNSNSSISHDREIHPASAQMSRKRSSGTAHAFGLPQHSSNCHHDHEHDHDIHDHHHHDHHHGHEHTSSGPHTNHDASHAHFHSHSRHQDHDHHDEHNHSDPLSHGSHQHSHDHAHSHNMRGVFLHVLADTLGSVGVIISTVLIRWTGWTGWDPLASLFIASLIMASVIPLVIDSGKVLCLDVGSDSEEQIRAALSELSSVSGVANYSSPRFWPRCEGELSGSIHIQLAPSPSTIDPFKQSSNSGRKDDTIYANADRVLARVEKVLKGRIRGLTELVIQVEGSEDRSYCSCMTGAG